LAIRPPGITRFFSSLVARPTHENLKEKSERHATNLEAKK
jgi:hypothetical protein